MNNLIEVFEQSQITKNLPEIKVGDTVKVYHKIQEGDKFKVQAFQGIVIAKKGERSRLRIVVRKISVGGIGVEKTFFLYHPLVVRVEILKRAKVRRAKLYYLRDAKGKKARKLKERIPEISEVLLWEAGDTENEKLTEKTALPEETSKIQEESGSNDFSGENSQDKEDLKNQENVPSASSEKQENSKVKDLEESEN
jgi:large subunit ribosomal protein L19